MLRRPGSYAAMLVAGLVAALLPAGSAAALGPATQATTQLVSLDITPSRTTLRQAELARVTVTAHLSDPDPGGVVPADRVVPGDRSMECPCVLVRGTGRTPQAWGARVLTLHLTSGTPNDGVWTASFLVGAADAGRWSVAQIAAGDLHLDDMFGDLLPVDRLLETVPAFDLQGSDFPELTLSLPRGPVRPGTTYAVSGTAHYATSHRPAVGLRLEVSYDACGWVDGVGSPAGVVRVDARGRWQLRSRAVSGSWCAVFGATPGAREAVSQVSVSRMFLNAAVTARPSSTSVRRGARVTVSGQITPASSGVLQQLSGRRWVRVRDIPFGRSFSVRVPTSPRGTSTYRVRVPQSDFSVGAGSSRSFQVRVR